MKTKSPEQPFPNEPPLREITPEFLRGHSSSDIDNSLNGLLMRITFFAYYGCTDMSIWCANCTDVSEETFNELEARGFGIIWKTKKSAQYSGYYLITWGAK